MAFPNLTPQTLTAQGRSSAHVCVSLAETGESAQASTPEERSLRPVALTYLTVSPRQSEVSPPLPHLPILQPANLDLSKQTKQIHQREGQSGISPRIRIDFTALIRYRSSDSARSGIRLEALKEQRLRGTTPRQAPPDRGGREDGDTVGDLSRSRRPVSVLG